TCLGDLARLEGDLAEAGRMYERAVEVMASAPFSSPQFRAITLSARAKLSLVRNDTTAAAADITAAADAAMEASDMPVLARVGVAAAELCLRLGSFGLAATTLGAAQQLRGAADPCNPDIVRLVRDLREELGDAAYDAAYTQGATLSRA